MTNWEWPDAIVTRVIDGDSIVARLTRDIGFHGAVIFEQRLRLNRINAAPIATHDGIGAAAMLESLTTQPVRIVTVKAYKYGDEWMAELYGPAGANINNLLVTNGAAVYWDGHGPRPGG